MVDFFLRFSQAAATFPGLSEGEAFILLHMISNSMQLAICLIQMYVLQRIYSHVASGKCLGVWCALPCGTLSRARRTGGVGPGPLRGESGRDLWGLPHISGRDLARVRSANKLIRIMCKLCKLCHKHNVAYYIENPLTSRLWKFAGIKHLIKLAHTSTTRFDFCQFGTLWRKGALILHSRNPHIVTESKTCKFGKGYVCSATGCRHVVLSGLHADGRHMTAHAEAYPTRFCSAIAHAVKENAVSEYLAKRSKGGH